MLTTYSVKLRYMEGEVILGSVAHRSRIVSALIMFLGTYA